MESPKCSTVCVRVCVCVCVIYMLRYVSIWMHSFIHVCVLCVCLRARARVVRVRVYCRLPESEWQPDMSQIPPGFEAHEHQGFFFSGFMSRSKVLCMV